MNVHDLITIAERSIAILELSTNKIRRIEAAADLVRTVVANIKPGQFLHLNIP